MRAAVLALAVVAGACSVPVERSDIPPEDAFDVGTVAYLDDLDVFIVHDPVMGVVAFDGLLSEGCPLLVVERLGERVFEDECDENRFRLDGSWITGPADRSLTPFPTYLGVDDHLYIEDDPQPVRDRLGRPVGDQTVTLDR